MSAGVSLLKYIIFYLVFLPTPTTSFWMHIDAH